MFWIPSLGLKAGVNHLVEDGSASSADFDDTEWGVGAALTFPLFQGGAKFADLRQARETLATLRTQRRAALVGLDDGIRAASAQANGAYAILGAVERQQKAADRYYDLTNESYVLGVASLLSLLDAQNQRLEATIAVTNARYDFLEAVVSAEEALSFFPFLEPAAEVAAWLTTLEQEVRSQP